MFVFCMLNCSVVSCAGFRHVTMMMMMMMTITLELASCCPKLPKKAPLREMQLQDHFSLPPPPPPPQPVVPSQKPLEAATEVTVINPEHILDCGIRVDDDCENDDICALVNSIRGGDHHAAIWGANVNNQRIERFWRDIWTGATNVFYNLFYYLEHSDYLDCDNEQHLWALHYVFLPRMNAAL